jgi:hypothetical protein
MSRQNVNREPRRDWPPISQDKRPEPWPTPPRHMDWASL